MKIALINPVIREWAKPNVPPIGLLLISSMLRQEGHDVYIWDVNGLRPKEEDVERWLKVDAGKFDLIGIGGLITQWNLIREMTLKLKQYYPNIPIMAGGPVVSNAPHLFTKRNPHIDAIVVGEGEYAVLDLVRDLQKGKLTANRTARITTQPVGASTTNGLQWEDFSSEVPIYQNTELPMDKIPYPDYDNLETTKVYLHNALGYKNQKRKWIDGGSDDMVHNLGIVTTRGCVFRCRFCQPRYLSSTARPRPTELIVDEIEKMVDTYGITYLHFLDEISFFSKNKAILFAKEMIKRGLNKKIEYGCPARIDTLNPESMDLLRESGMVWLGLGVESLSQEVLTMMDKYIQIEGGLEKVVANIKYARGVFPVVDTSFIIGYPGETKETIDETIQNMHRIGDDFRPKRGVLRDPVPADVAVGPRDQEGLHHRRDRLHRGHGREQRRDPLQLHRHPGRRAGLPQAPPRAGLADRPRRQGPADRSR